MFLSAILTSVSVLSLSLCVVFSCFFACPVIFDWMLDTVNFTLLGTGYFCIPIYTYELYSEVQLFGNTLILLCLAFKVY